MKLNYRQLETFWAYIFILPAILGLSAPGRLSAGFWFLHQPDRLERFL